MLSKESSQKIKKTENKDKEEIQALKANLENKDHMNEKT